MGTVGRGIEGELMNGIEGGLKKVMLEGKGNGRKYILCPRRKYIIYAGSE
jgi:hypothetical protein